jgi:hypothetical protein
VPCGTRLAPAGPSAGRDRVPAIRRSRSLEPSPIKGRKYTDGFENVFAAREDARPPGEGTAAPVHQAPAHPRPPDEADIERVEITTQRKRGPSVNVYAMRAIERPSMA